MNKISYIFLCCCSLQIFALPFIVLIGPPGCGKGTFCSFMIQRFGYKQVCIGDLLRTQIRHETELGKVIKPIVEKGEYIDDHIVFAIIGKEIENLLAQKELFIVDGFPRNRAGLDFLDEFLTERGLKKNVIYIHFTIDDQTCIDRINTRFVCPSCLDIYNETSKKPKIGMVCDRCGESLQARLGDTHSNTIKRLAYYRSSIEPLVQASVERGYRVISVNCAQPVRECVALYENLFLANM